MGPATKETAARLAAAIREVATEQRHHRLAERAEQGEFADYGSAHVCGPTEAHRLCLQFGLRSIAARLAAGEFDASLAESNEWANSPDGQAAAKELSPAMREMLGLKLKN